MNAKRVVFYFLSHSGALVLGGTLVYVAAMPVSIVWGILFGTEIHSQASFPMGHMARIYSAPGMGDQQLIFLVDGRRIYRTPDFEPGNVDEKIAWDPLGKSVTFIASGRKIFTYNTETGVGTLESGNNSQGSERLTTVDNHIVAAAGWE